MKLLPNEEKLITSNADKIVLTDHRIQMTDSVWGKTFTISIFLEDISSIETKYKSKILFIILGAICVLGGVYIAGEYSADEGIALLILGVIFFAVWWFTRKHIVSISSDGGSSLNFMVHGTGKEKIQDFVHSVSVAKQKRVNQLHKV